MFDTYKSTGDQVSEGILHSQKTWIGLGVALTLFSCNPKREKIQPSLEELVISVDASVLVQPAELYSVYPEAAGVIEALYVEEGDLLSKGQSIAKVSSPNKQVDVSSAQRNAAFAEKNLKGDASRLSVMEEEMRTIQKQLVLDSLNYFRQKRLWEQNIGAKTDLENKKLRYDLTRDQLITQKKKIEQTQLELENNLTQSRYDLQRSLNTLQDFSIRSKIDGRLFELYKKEGELISMQDALAKIGASDAFLLEMQVDEVDIAHVRIGQKIIISLDAFEGQAFKASVSKIFPTKNTLTQTFKVEALFDTLPTKLYAGLSGEANIIIERKPNTLTIPMAYLIEGDKVLTETGEIAVTTGAKTLNKVEILSGIDAATVLLKP